MTLRLALAAALACALAFPDRAAAQGYTGQLGGYYVRSQQWSPTGDTLLTPQLNLDGNIAANGFISGPDVARWNGDLSLLAARSGENLGDTANTLNFGLGLGLFQTNASRLPITVFANRSTVDSAFDLNPGNRLTGTTTGTTYGGAGGVNVPGMPTLRFGANRLYETNSGYGRAPSNQTTDTVTAGFRHSPGVYQIDGDYNGQFRTGTLAVNNYDQHAFRLQGAAIIAPLLTAYASDFYQQRTATTSDPTNPTSLSNSFNAGVRGVDADNMNRWYVAYDYSHFFIEAPGVDPNEQFSHGLTGQAERTLAPEFSSRFSVGANLTDFRLGGTQQIASGESVGGVVTWTHILRPGNVLLLEAGPTIGAIQPKDQSSEFAYGAEGRARWVLEAVRSELEYRINWAKNLAAAQGTTLTQRLRFDYSHRMSRRSRVSAYAFLDSIRQDSPLFGTSVGQNAQAEGVLAWAQERYVLRAGATYSAVPTVFASGTISDGLFIPANFAARTASAYVSINAAVTPRLRVEGGARYGSGFGGGIPSQKEYGLVGTLGYTLGLLTLSIEDRYTRGGATSFDSRANFFFVRLTRTFGGRF